MHYLVFGLSRNWRRFSRFKVSLSCSHGLVVSPYHNVIHVICLSPILFLNSSLSFPCYPYFSGFLQFFCPRHRRRRRRHLLLTLSTSSTPFPILPQTFSPKTFPPPLVLPPFAFSSPPYLTLSLLDTWLLQMRRPLWRGIQYAGCERGPQYRAAGRPMRERQG